MTRSSMASMIRSINSLVDGVTDEPTFGAAGDDAASRMLVMEDRNWTDCVSFASTWLIKRRSMPTDDSSPAEPPLPATTADAVTVGVGAGSDSSDPDPVNSAG